MSDNDIRNKARMGILTTRERLRHGLPCNFDVKPFWETECSTDGCSGKLYASDCFKCADCMQASEFLYSYTLPAPKTIAYLAPGGRVQTTAAPFTCVCCERKDIEWTIL